MPPVDQTTDAAEAHGSKDLLQDLRACLPQELLMQAMRRRHSIRRDLLSGNPMVYVSLTCQAILAAFSPFSALARELRDEMLASDIELAKSLFIMRWISLVEGARRNTPSVEMVRLNWRMIPTKPIQDVQLTLVHLSGYTSWEDLLLSGIVDENDTAILGRRIIDIFGERLEAKVQAAPQGYDVHSHTTRVRIFSDDDGCYIAPAIMN